MLEKGCQSRYTGIAILANSPVVDTVYTGKKRYFAGIVYTGLVSKIRYTDKYFCASGICIILALLLL